MMVLICGLWRSTSVPRPIFVGRKGTRIAAARRPSRNMPSSISMISSSPFCRARRKYGSSGMKSSDTKANTTLRTLPAAHSMPTSAPP